MPRGWIVHDVRPYDDASLPDLNSGAVDGRKTAFVDDFTAGVFDVAAPVDGAAEPVEFTAYSADAMTMQVTVASDGLLVLGEIASKGWTARVDGKDVPIYHTNHALRGIPVPAGSHTVTLTYAPPHLTAGMWISGLTGTGMVAIWIGCGVVWWRENRLNRNTKKIAT
jgi:hypothetical protein